MGTVFRCPCPNCVRKIGGSVWLVLVAVGQSTPSEGSIEMSEVNTSKPISGKQTEAKPKSASRRAKASLPATTLEDATDEQVKALQLKIGLAHKKPTWEVEQLRTERKLWEVAALANGLSPDWKGLSARRQLDENWNQCYTSMIKAMCDALLPTRTPDDIYYDPARPANHAIQAKPEKHHTIRVDVASATAFLIKKYGAEALPPQFVIMHQAIQRAHPATSSKHPTADVLNDLVPRKSQEKAIETTSSNLLAILLYAVVEKEIGWSAGDTVGRERTVARIFECLDRHEIQSTRGLTPSSIENYLLKGAALAPLKFDKKS